MEKVYYINKKKLLNLFFELIRVLSPSLNEGLVHKIITKKLRKIGLKVLSDKAGEKIGGEVGNIYALLPATPGFKKIPAFFLNAHLDTVKIDRKVKPVIKNKNFVMSDGKTILGADDKAGVAIILGVLNLIQEKKIPHGDIEVVFTVAEEIGLKGAKNFDCKRLSSKFGYVLDGGADPGKMIIAAPSQRTFEAVFTGKATHAGIHPEKGINAIKIASFAISKLKLGRLDKETTANVGVINGGVATNIVPDKVVVKGEVRSHNNLKLNKVIGEIKKIFKQTAINEGGGLKWSEVEEYKNYRLSQKSLCIRAFQSAARACNQKVSFEVTCGGSDANIFNKAGITCAVIPTGMVNPHSPDEKLNLKSFYKSAQIVLNLIRVVAEGTY